MSKILTQKEFQLNIEFFNSIIHKKYIYDESYIDDLILFLKQYDLYSKRNLKALIHSIFNTNDFYYLKHYNIIDYMYEDRSSKLKKILND